MPTYKITDPSTGQTLRLTGDSPPTEQELEQIFSSISDQSPKNTDLISGAKEVGKSVLSSVAKMNPLTAGFSAASDIADSTGKTKREIAEKVVNSPVMPVAGGVAGGLAAGVPGAALGGAAGEAFRQIAAKALDQKAPDTSLEAAKDIGVSAASQAAGEVGGKVLGPVVKGAGEAIGNLVKQPMSDLFQLITKIKPSYAETLFKNPKAILPSEWKAAKEAWRTAAQQAGLPVDDVSPEIIKALKQDARSTVFDTFEKMQSGDSVSAAEAQTAKQALDIALMPAAKTERNSPLVALYGKMRQGFVDRISQDSPALAEANKNYAIAKAGNKFRSIFPRNLDNSPAYFRSSILPAFLLGRGYAQGDTGGGAMKAAGAVLGSSPLAIGTLIALAGSGQGLVPYAGRTLTAGLAELAGERLKRR